MSRRIYEMECRRDERARQAMTRVITADKAASPARHVKMADHADDVPQATQNALMESSEGEQTVLGKAVVSEIGLQNLMCNIESCRTQL